MYCVMIVLNFFCNEWYITRHIILEGLLIRYGSPILAHIPHISTGILLSDMEATHMIRTRYSIFWILSIINIVFDICIDILKFLNLLHSYILLYCVYILHMYLYFIKDWGFGWTPWWLSDQFEAGWSTTSAKIGFSSYT